MGIYDRDYERERNYDDGSPGYHLGGERSWTTNLVILMGIVYVVQLLTGLSQRQDGWFTELFSLHADLPRKPWFAFQLFTYGFLHSYDFRHILFNAFALWMFGRFVEQRFVKKEYLTFFLAAVAFAGLFWLLSEIVANGQLMRNVILIGASGGIASVLVLFCLLFPHQTVFLGFLFPIPAWIFAIFFVGQDLFFAIRNNSDDNVAYTAHIGGALFAVLYYKAGWRLSNWLPGRLKLPKLRRRPPLRVVDPADEVDEATDDVVDNILRKIREQGQDSLTAQERRILQEASREYQKKRR